MLAYANDLVRSSANEITTGKRNLVRPFHYSTSFTCPTILRSIQCRSKGKISGGGGGGGGGTRAPVARSAWGVWGHAPPGNFGIKRLRNAISSVLQGLFVIHAYRISYVCCISHIFVRSTGFVFSKTFIFRG